MWILYELSTCAPPVECREISRFEKYAMPQKYRQLARHNSVCNEVYYKFQDCEIEHPVARFIGACTQFQKNLEKCIKANRETMRTKNREMAEARRQKFNAEHASTDH
ncbi:hypothetical protein TSAR_016549 [Trichomalopsis sarcophagae]|uniref:COX assembly mitochondrial protein n=1 Tax=Trichomalopsis sarcophagae TaxID=543379 RepID=A0A232F0Y0_9HYME|nr:hypothetical protein TSAR_016549 [Trichomalopsis sarcophagae]